MPLCGNDYIVSVTGFAFLSPVVHDGVNQTYPQGFAQLLSEKGACVTVMPSCCLIHAMHYGELATFGGSPLSGFAGLSPIRGTE